MPHNVYGCIADYLDLTQRPTPLIRLDDPLNPLAAAGVEIWMKILHHGTQPGKAIPVWSILADAERRGLLDGVHTIVDSSSGNTALALAAAAARASLRAVTVVPSDLPPGKLEPLRLIGAQVEFSGSGDPIQLARQIGERPGHFYLNQYFNESNPLGHERITGAQIVEQTGGSVTVAACAIGTAGTMLGVKRSFRKRGIDALVVGVICADGQSIPGMRDEARLRKIGLDWREADEIRNATLADAYFASLRMTQANVPCGPSAGAALWELLGFLSERNEEGRLDELRNAEGKVVAVIPVIDSLAPYWDKVSAALGPEQIVPQRMPLPAPALAVVR
jgi:cysteine synthase